MREFSISVEIDAAPARVWAVMTDIERWHEWTASVRRIRQLDRGPLRPGVRALIRQPKFPPALWKIVAIDPGRTFTWVSRAPGFSVVARHSVEAAGHGSRATLALEFQGIFGGWFGRLTRDINNRYLALEAAGLKRRSEHPGRF
jgi:hypothetical protein